MSDGQDGSLNTMKVANWRVGPARLWYDQIGLGLDLPTYDYGFKLKQPQSAQTQISKDETTNDNASLPVNLTRWEDDIVYDITVLRDKLELNSPKIRYCGWVPTTNYRSLASFQKNVFGMLETYSNPIFLIENFVVLGKNVDYLESTTGKIIGI